MTGLGILATCVAIIVVAFVIVHELLLWLAAFVVWAYGRVRAR